MHDWSAALVLKDLLMLELLLLVFLANDFRQVSVVDAGGLAQAVDGLCAARLVISHLTFSD